MRKILLILALLPLSLAALSTRLDVPALVLSVWGETPHPGKPNRLIHEKSPYLLQHAYNPVDWRPWGPEAFEAARRENKPIFLSIGYSTCHWCHVMERESFSNPEIAAVMNRHFICVKVDREERPDVDQVHMAFVQATTGGGGWPMSVFLTPDLKPFFGGTYFPPTAVSGRPGFKEILEILAREWETNHDKIVDSATEIADKLKQSAERAGSSSGQPERSILESGFARYEKSFDATNGGFGGAPKFPQPVALNFLLRHHARTGNPQALEMALLTLRRMSEGGIHDHLGGGFHRYSTDARWFLPHFEKMLYDQAQLAVSYLEAYQLTREPLFEQTARDILDYVLSRMTDPAGGFYSAEDADSALVDEPGEKAEGAFYVWTAEEVSRVLGDDELFAARFGVRADGNVEVDHFGEFKGKNILFAAVSPEELSGKFGLSAAEVVSRLESARGRLLQAREKRPRPLRDDKVLTAWNGLMISAFSKAAQTLGDDRYRKAAENAARFLQTNLYNHATKRLQRRWRQGEAAVDGFADDYFFLVQGLLDLYETTLQDRWLLWAMDLSESADRLFLDRERGGWFTTAGTDPHLLLRLKDDYDGAEPAPSSVATLNLLRLSQLAPEGPWKEEAGKSLQAFAARLEQVPTAMPQMLAALDFHLEKPLQILIAGDADSPDTKAIAREIHRRFIPAKAIFLADGGPAQKRLSPGLEILSSLKKIDGKATAYICRDYVCQLPSNDPAKVGRLLDEQLNASRPAPSTPR